jgi:hypothetical protein
VTENVKNVVTAYIKGLEVDPDPIHLSRSAGEEAEWRSDSPVQIEFDISPFKNGQRFESRDGLIHSGPIKDDASGEYAYVIRSAQGGELDPRVIIDR